MKKLFTFFLLVVMFTGIAVAQDIHLSQFYNSDLLLNPAKTGDFDGDYRITANYRNQWREISNPISTYLVGFDKGFHYYTHEFDGGILVARDEFGGFQTVTTKVLLSAAYAYTYKEHNFRGGLQTGMVFNKTNLDNQTFPDQWNFNPGPNQTGFFDPNIPNMENSLNPANNYLDINAGVQWSKKYKKIQPKIGFAANHINRPKNSYFSTFTERLRARKVVHAEMNYIINEKTILQPKLLFMWTTKANDMVLGTNVRHALKNKSITSIYWGAHYRHGVMRLVDAVIPTVGLKYKKFDLGFSYDVNVSSLSNGTKRKSSLEFSLIYIAASSKTRYITIPCERY